MMEKKYEIHGFEGIIDYEVDGVTYEVEYSASVDLLGNRPYDRVVLEQPKDMDDDTWDEIWEDVEDAVLDGIYDRIARGDYE